jgi:hypothetical protein
MMEYLIPLILTIIAAAWRYADGRGIPTKTALRNVAGIVVALMCGWVGVGGWLGLACGGLAALTLIAGYTKWESWEVSLPRYGGPTMLIAIVASFGGADLVPSVAYGLSGFMVAIVSVTTHNLLPGQWDFARDNATKISEVVAGATIIGGIAWL